MMYLSRITALSLLTLSVISGCAKKKEDSSPTPTPQTTETAAPSATPTTATADAVAKVDEQVYGTWSSESSDWMSSTRIDFKITKDKISIAMFAQEGSEACSNAVSTATFAITDTKIQFKEELKESLTSESGRPDCSIEIEKDSEASYAVSEKDTLTITFKDSDPLVLTRVREK